MIFVRIYWVVRFTLLDTSSGFPHKALITCLPASRIETCPCKALPTVFVNHNDVSMPEPI